MPTKLLDVAIIGAGVSGVYSGWRLKEKHPDFNITVFEGSDRVGGRLLSVPAPGIPDMVAELGGMRILPSVQPRIKRLIEVLNLSAPTPEDQIETYPFPVDEEMNIAYLRGIHLRLLDFEENPEAVPYNLTFQEYGKTAGELVLDAIEQIVPGITNPDLSETQRRVMAQKTNFAGKPLYKQGFWGVLMRVLSGEAYQLALAAGGYQSTLSNWNAADAIPWYLSDFGIDPDYRGFKKGFQQVPLQVADRFTAAGGKISFNQYLRGFEVDGDVINLHFHDGEKVKAKKLILAMPRRSLDLISDQSPLLQDARAERLIGSVTPRPLFKLFTTYQSPWWIPAGVEKGRTVTDLPVRQTYYWPNDDGSPAEEGPAMLMASYDDGANIGFWDGFRNKRGRHVPGGDSSDLPMRELFKPDHRDLAPGDLAWDKYRAPRAMVDEVQRQLGTVHGLMFVPDAREASYKDWGDDPYGGGWNSWNIGVQSWKVLQDVIQPVPNQQVYICGEAYSDAQGWVEGALQTADMMLEKYFDIPDLK